MSGGVIDKNELNGWVQRFNTAVNTKAWSNASPADAKPWSSGLFGCFSPPDLCLLTCCLPCVTFGKTHHRLRKNGDMQGYEPINTSCIAFYLSSCFGASFIMQALQLQDIREQHHLEGSCVKDLLLSCCCLCCSLVQAEKETKILQNEKPNVVSQQYGGASEQMVMGGAQQAPIGGHVQ
ncbi:PLAC8-domain-containing protein [Lophiostoma macrostomum CBS 122681]|uniref:PLAC8-domain-containing protein n=1 Tax=Lophiostoma macrostomum CBS 122681 TaxID=1314788 RepID=A0A6A6TDC2_9PLEO|nr:PLAC8-domain-containing protein [Lophiostoma macrostomum CBS 122681]